MAEISKLAILGLKVLLTIATRRRIERWMPRSSKKPRAPLPQSNNVRAPGLLEPVTGPELVFGLVGPIGTDLTLVSTRLSKELEKVGYKTILIRVSDSLKEFVGTFDLVESPLEERYKTYMDAGNKIREVSKRQDALALLSVMAVRARRVALSGDRIRPHPHTAYILSQFKRPEEIKTLRRVYGRGFIQISAYCSKDKRLDELTAKIAASHYHEKNDDWYRGKAQDLISRDDIEEENEYGQRVRDTFPLADVVLNADSETEISQTCERFVRAFFGDNFCTPTHEEYGMYMARAAALRSADLSRQVGAAIFKDSGEIIAFGCNEVPKAGGGTYWEGDPNDSRDFRLGYDSSTKMKRQLLEDAFRRLRAAGWFKPEKQSTEIGNLVEEALSEGDKGIFREAQVMDILEFGRIVHAEMAAISDAAKVGLSLHNATLYCTTFPCHICARHIVSTGIKQVIYIEPYSKSLASDLYPDSIEAEGRSKEPGPKVVFKPFIGIAPQRYLEIFSKDRRKNASGRARSWSPTSAKPILERLVPAYIQIESSVAEEVAQMLDRAKLKRKKTPKTKTRIERRTRKFSTSRHTS